MCVCRLGRDDRVAQEGTAGDRAVVQGRIDQQCLIESGRARGGQKETPVSRSQSGRRPSRATDPTGAEGPGVAVDEEEEDENLVSTALEKWMKRMVQSGLKREPKTPRPAPLTPPTPAPLPPTTARPALKRPAAPVPTKKTTTQKPGPSAKKKKKSFMRGMLEEGLLAGYKIVDPTPRARRRLDPAEGWEDWAQGRKLRRPLAGNDY